MDDVKTHYCFPTMVTEFSYHSDDWDKKQQEENKTAADITRDVMGGDLNKGKLIARPPTKKKPTKGKTLVQKKS